MRCSVIHSAQLCATPLTNDPEMIKNTTIALDSLLLWHHVVNIAVVCARSRAMLKYVTARASC